MIHCKAIVSAWFGVGPNHALSPRPLGLWICLLIGFPFLLLAQNVEDLPKERLQTSGNIGVSSHFYQFNGDGRPRNAPLGYAIRGSLNASFSEINLPITFSISQQQNSLSAPFNLYGMSPYYRWLKLHLGHRVLNFSPYTFSGRAFLGAGIELTPGIFRFTAFSGTLRNMLALQDVDDINGPLVLPSYRRKISGLKVGLGGKSLGFELMGVRIQDDTSQGLIADNPLTPVENVVLGSKIYAQVAKRIRIEGNIAASLFSENSLARGGDLVPDEFSRINSLLQPNITTRLSFAGDASLNYSHKGFSTGLKYRRIDPFFQSFGINFLQNDVENYTLQLAAPLFKKKLRVNATLGVQQDNLKNHKAFQSQRWIGSLAANYSPGRKASAMLRYSNYQHENQSGLVQVNDTLKFVTTTQNIYAGGRIQTHENSFSRSIWSINAFRNEMVNETAREGGFNPNFTGLGLSSQWMYSTTESGWNLGPLFNFNRYIYSNRTQGRIGLGANIGKHFWKRKLQSNLQIMYNSNRLNEENNGQLLTFSFRSAVQVGKGHLLELRCYYLDNSSLAGGLQGSFQELRGHLAYSYSFQPTKKP